MGAPTMFISMKKHTEETLQETKQKEEMKSKDQTRAVKLQAGAGEKQEKEEDKTRKTQEEETETRQRTQENKGKQSETRALSRSENTIFACPANSPPINATRLLSWWTFAGLFDSCQWSFLILLSLSSDSATD